MQIYQIFCKKGEGDKGKGELSNEQIGELMFILFKTYFSSNPFCSF